MARRVVLTGGPGAGKTAVLELMRQSVCRHVKVLPESAGIVFGGGFPRRKDPVASQAAQRAIYHVQHELEAAEAGDNPAILLCDRGTLDGWAYWSGPDDFWQSVGTTREKELLRYHAVIHLRTPAADAGYTRENPLRIETAQEAAVIDARISEVWREHPRQYAVDASQAFLEKATRALELIRAELPACCRSHAAMHYGAEPFATASATAASP